MHLAKIRLFDALSISYFFHFVVITLAWAGLILLDKKSPEPEKVRMAILLQTPKSENIPIPYPIQKVTPPTPAVEQKQLPTPTPVKTPALAPTKPTITAPQPTPITPSVSVPKAIESVPVPKAPPPPPPPKIEENYAEENLGRIRTILAERLKYPKNALRLKQQGECIVTFSLGTDREVNQITITQSSGFDLLDDAAKTLIETSASEFPKPKKSVRISVPIAYKLH